MAAAFFPIVALCAASFIPASQASASTGQATAAAAEAQGHYFAVTPHRVLDTRVSHGKPVGPRKTVTISVSSLVRNDAATSVVINLTATAGTTSGFLVAYPAGASRPTASNMNWTKGTTVANLATVGFGSSAGRTDSISLYNGSSGTVHLIADVSGYFATGSISATNHEQSLFGQTTSTRVLDTRAGIGAGKRSVPSDSAVTVKVAGVGSVPVDASAVVLNVTATAATSPGYATAYPYGSARPGSSNLNFLRGSTVADLVVVPVGDHGSISIYNGSGGTTQIIGDLQGYLYAGSPATQGAFGALNPVRQVDTRASHALAGHSSFTLNPDGFGGVPGEDTVAVAYTVTATAPQAAGFLSVYGGNGDGPPPTVSNVNFLRGQTVANSVLVHPTDGGSVVVYNGSARPVQVIMDVTGFVRDYPAQIPSPTDSRYTTDLTKLADQSDTGDGCTDGGYAGEENGLVLLDIGAQSVTYPLTKTHPGVALARTSGPKRVTYSVLADALAKYVTAFVRCSHYDDDGHPPRIALGTSTSGAFSGANAYAADKRGEAWAALVAEVQTASPYVTIVGANDIEANFAASEAQAMAWETSFLKDNSLTLIDNGSLDNCPDTFDSVASTCGPVKDENGVTKTWTYANYLQLIGENANGRISVLPQIYYANHPNNAAQWALLLRRAGRYPIIEGVLAQNAICGLSCGYTAEQAAAAFYNAFAATLVPEPVIVASELQPS